MLASLRSDEGGWVPVEHGCTNWIRFKITHVVLNHDPYWNFYRFNFPLSSALLGSKMGPRSNNFHALAEESACFTEDLLMGQDWLFWDF